MLLPRTPAAARCNAGLHRGSKGELLGCLARWSMAAPLSSPLALVPTSPSAHCLLMQSDSSLISLRHFHATDSTRPVMHSA